MLRNCLWRYDFKSGEKWSQRRVPSRWKSIYSSSCPFRTVLSNTYIVGCFNDHCFMAPFYISVCLCGTSYVLLACLSLVSQPPAPIPLLHCLFSAGILFWLNGHKHKLSISSNSWSSAWQMKITLAKELFTSSKPCLGPLVQRKPEWKVKSAIAPQHPLCA